VLYWLLGGAALRHARHGPDLALMIVFHVPVLVM
jgi:hypothetical protein